MSNKEILDLITSKENEIKKIQEEVRILKLKANEYSDEIKTFSNEDKIKIFMDYFKGGEDTYPYLSIDKNNPTKKYYIPACNNEWKNGVCNKTMKKSCKTCKYRDNRPLTYDVYENHLRGSIIGIYPLMDDDTCFFLAFDFDDKLEEKIYSKHYYNNISKSQIPNLDTKCVYRGDSMNIENEIFKKSIIVYDKLIPYGFKKIAEKYKTSKKILNDSFRVDVEISENGIVRGKIYDLSFNEEYTNYRIENQTGEFVNKIRKEFEDLLIDIREHCTITNYFVTNQANRITNLIIKQYNDVPKFAWDKFPGYGIFKNPHNDKWYGLIMNINKNKIDNGNEEVEILNVKLDEDKIKHLLSKKGFYKAYHMNKENWITILLDDTIKDEEIMSYIEESHKFTEQVDEWIIPANPKYYDVINCFNNTDTIMWKQSNNISIGDLVYLYVADPYSSILYKCKVLEVNIPYEYKDKNISMSKVMKIKLLTKYDKNKFTFEKLKEYGIKWVRGPRFMPKELSIEMNK